MKRKICIVVIPIIIAALGMTAASAASYTSANFVLMNARVVVSAGSASSASYVLGDVAIGNFISGKAASANYMLDAGLIFISDASIVIDSIVWNIDNPIERGGVGYVKAVIRNIGSMKVNLKICVFDREEADNKRWVPGDNEGENELNKYLLSVLITSKDMQNVIYNENGNEDYVSETYLSCTSQKFTCSGSTENGIGILPGQERALHLKFEAPNVDTTGASEHEEHFIYIQVRADVSN